MEGMDWVWDQGRGEAGRREPKGRELRGVRNGNILRLSECDM